MNDDGYDGVRRRALADPAPLGGLPRLLAGRGRGPRPDHARCAATPSWPKVQRADQPRRLRHTVLVNAFRESRRRRWWGERPTATTCPTSPCPTTPTPSRRPTPYAAPSTGSPQPARGRRPALLPALSERETADALGIPPGTVKSRLSAALKHLATALDPTGDH